MNKVKTIIRICKYQLKIHIRLKRVWMGYLLGFAIIIKYVAGYWQYANELGANVNILEAFVVGANDYNAVLLLTLGWFLVIADAPFINQNAMYILCRTDKRTWNAAMMLYVICQAGIYYGTMAAGTVLMSVPVGYWANIWSRPMIYLTKEIGNPVSFSVSFAYPDLIKTVSIFRAFGYTWLLTLLYGVILAAFLYMFSLIMRRIAGITVALAVHFLGYEIMQEGFMLNIQYSLLARSILVFQMDSKRGATLAGTIALYMGLLLMMYIISMKVVYFYEDREITEREEL